MQNTVDTVMTRDIYAVAFDTSIETAARLLAQRHIGGLPVVSPTGTPIGVVSLADLVDPDRPRGDHEGHPLFYRIDGGQPVEIGEDVLSSGGQVADVMSPFVLSVDASASLVDAARLMLQENVHRLLVLREGRLVGIVTTTDIMKGLVRNLP